MDRQEQNTANRVVSSDREIIQTTRGQDQHLECTVPWQEILSSEFFTAEAMIIHDFDLKECQLELFKLQAQIEEMKNTYRAIVLADLEPVGALAPEHFRKDLSAFAKQAEELHYYFETRSSLITPADIRKLAEAVNDYTENLVAYMNFPTTAECLSNGIENLANMYPAEQKKLQLIRETLPEARRAFTAGQPAEVKATVTRIALDLSSIDPDWSEDFRSLSNENSLSSVTKNSSRPLQPA